jgi:purine-binding chemotaxis protein CheW
MMPNPARQALPAQSNAPLHGEREYVTLKIGSQLLGLPIEDVREVFAPQGITPVPLSAPAVTGLLNLRGRVVTAICLRSVLGLPPGEASVAERMAIGVEVDGEPFALLVDGIGDVMRLPASTLEPNPIHMDRIWRNYSRGVHRLETSILVILDLGSVIGSGSLAA